MAKASCMEWKNKTITCFVVNYCANSFSFPLTIKIRKRDGLKRIDDMVDTLVHELIHVLFGMNKVYLLNEKLGMKSEFRNESRVTKNHIYLHALHNYLYLKLFSRKRLEKDIASSPYRVRSGYARAWEIVEQYGYENLLNRLRDAAKKSR